MNTIVLIESVNTILNLALIFLLLHAGGDFSASVAPFGRECIPVLESYIHSSHGPPPSRSTNTAIQ